MRYTVNLSFKLPVPLLNILLLLINNWTLFNSVSANKNQILYAIRKKLARMENDNAAYFILELFSTTLFKLDLQKTNFL